MMTERLEVKHPYDVVLVILVIVIKHFKNFQLYTGLVLKPLFVPNNFNRYCLMCLVVIALDRLSKAA